METYRYAAATLFRFACAHTRTIPCVHMYILGPRTHTLTCKSYVQKISRAQVHTRARAARSARACVARALYTTPIALTPAAVLLSVAYIVYTIHIHLLVYASRDRNIALLASCVFGSSPIASCGADCCRRGRRGRRRHHRL